MLMLSVGFHVGKDINIDKLQIYRKISLERFKQEKLWN